MLDAMSYAVMGGGKRLRPMLACASCEAFGGDYKTALPASCAFEFIHAYSLIHDDLPAMDDEELRHGRASTHVAFGEANAMLAGDSLHSLAFQAISEDADMSPASKLTIISLLSKAAGWPGMSGGQCLDIEAEGKELTLEELEIVCRTFMEMGTRKIRLTGGEPLVRRNILQLIRALGAEATAGALGEVTITTNGSQLKKMAKQLAAAAVSR